MHHGRVRRLGSPWTKSGNHSIARLVVLTTLGFGVVSLNAEVLCLKNGNRIVVDRFWEDGDQVFYELNGGMFGFPRSLLDHVERELPPIGSSPLPAQRNDSARGFENETVSDTIVQARRSTQEGDLEEASRLYREALSVAPDSVIGRLELAELLIKRGNLVGAQSQLEQAKRVAPEESTVRDKLGEVYYMRGRTALAVREWQKALELAPSAYVRDKLNRALRENNQDIDFEELRRPHFLIRYDGAVNEIMGQAVAAALDEEYLELTQNLGFSPVSPVSVILSTRQEREAITPAPSWMVEFNDEEIRLPVQGLELLTPELRQIARHELTRSFLHARTGGRCPAWLQEGFAQYRADPPPDPPYDALRRARDAGTLIPLWGLEGPLAGLSVEQAQLAYLEAFAAVRYIVDRGTERALARILDRLAEQRTMNDALREVIGLDYQSFQTAWEADLDRYRLEP